MSGIVISYGGLEIANSEANLRAGQGATCAGDELAGANGECALGGATGTTEVPVVNDDVVLSLSTDKTKLTIMWGADQNPAAADDMITLDGIRVDVSGEDAGDDITVSISVAGSGDSVDVGGGETSRVSTVVSAVKAGLTVPEVVSKMLLTCDGTAQSPSIKVAEGFGSAWEVVGTGSSYSGEATNVFIQVLNVPSGVEFKWPKTVGSAEVKAGTPETVRRDAGESVLTLESAEKGSSAIYSYSEPGVATTEEAAGYMNDAFADSFVIVPEATTGATTVASDKPADAWAYLHPSIGSESGLSRRLSYAKSPMTDDNDDSTAIPGQFVTLGDCVTYLLFPYVTCSGADWTTGFAISNTTKDDEVFGRELTEKEKTEDPDQDRGGAVGQSGAVYVYSYPMSPKAADGGSGTVPDGNMTMVSSKLAPGDTLAATCEAAGMAGMDGYAIVEARFQEARGMAFVLGNFADGAVYDVAHGYESSVIGVGSKSRD
jgi:hypothetical protein